MVRRSAVELGRHRITDITCRMKDSGTRGKIGIERGGDGGGDGGGEGEEEME